MSRKETMETETASKEIITEGLPTKGEVVENIKALANPKCSKCGGRGILGYNVVTDKFVLCNAKRCALRNYVFLLHKLEEANKKKAMEKVEGTKTESTESGSKEEPA